jgi:hypothetical protein
MTCAEVHPNLAAFVLGGLEPEEAAMVQRHLASCSGCRNELRELEKLKSALQATPPLPDPPAYLRGEILSRVREHARAEESSSDKGAFFPSSEESRSFEAPRSNRFRNVRTIIPSVAAAAVVAIVALGAVIGFLREEPTIATIQLVPTPAEAKQLEGYWGVAEIHSQPSGNLQVVLKLNNFEESKPHTYYEVWFVSGDRRISAGSFTSIGEGETRVWLTVPDEARHYPTLLITEERADGHLSPSEGVALKGEVP